MSFEVFSQIWIGFWGSLGFLMIAKRQRWGFVCVLVTEPFWFYSTWQSRQWGMFFLTVIYTISMLLGIDDRFFGARCWRVLMGAFPMHRFTR
jgi:hypothetical protein